MQCKMEKYRNLIFFTSAATIPNLRLGVSGIRLATLANAQMQIWIVSARVKKNLSLSFNIYILTDFLTYLC